VNVVVGAGCSRGCCADELLGLIDAALAELGRPSVRTLATNDVKAGEPGLRAAAGRRGWPVELHTAQALRDVAVPTPSAVVAGHVGTPSVAEAAALLSARGGGLLVAKRRSARATCAVAEALP